MSNLDKLIERGAIAVGGDLILRHKVMGQFRNGDFFVSEDGLLELDVEEVVAKPRRKKAEEAAPDAADDVTIEV
jgi:hypothetical protein